MKKFRLLFLIVVLAVFVASILALNTFKAPLNPGVTSPSEFKPTQISGSGNVYFSKKSIDTVSFNSLETLDIRRMNYADAMYIRADDHTAFEFYCAGTAFTVLPGTYLYYEPRTDKLYFYHGEFYWQKLKANKKIDISVQHAQNIMTLSGGGRARISEKSVEVWNYEGDLKLWYEEQENKLKGRQSLVLKKITPRRSKEEKTITSVFDLLPSPESIDPLKQTVSLKKSEDSMVRFNWKDVPAAGQYIFRLYDSDLKENLLLEKYTDDSRFNCDLLQFSGREFYWQVFPLDIRDQQEGVPSSIGRIRLIGALLKRKDIRRAPELSIKSLTVEGNRVTVKGKADPDAQLTVNGGEVGVDIDGQFSHTLYFRETGTKKIEFFLVTDMGLESSETRYVTIYPE